MDRLQLISICASACLLLGVLELVRRRRLLERYAIGWLTAAAITLAFATWGEGLSWLADRLGIVYPPNALFLLAFGLIILLLLHFSAAVSRLTDQSKVLAQRMAILEERIQCVEAASSRDDEPRSVLRGVER